MKKLLIIFIVISILFTPYTAFSQDKELDVPDEYDKLLERYREMVNIAQKYKELYEESNDNFKELQSKYEETLTNLKKIKEIQKEQSKQTEKLIESNNNLQDLIETQNKIINDLLNKKEISVETGIGVNIKNPTESLLMLGFNFSL